MIVTSIVQVNKLNDRYWVRRQNEEWREATSEEIREILGL